LGREEEVYISNWGIDVGRAKKKEELLTFRNKDIQGLNKVEKSLIRWVREG